MSFGFGFGFPRGGNAIAWSPLSLFTGGTVGAWYDPSDYSTLFQTINGSTPVTAVEQPVGLMLDKSQGATLGPELVTNGNFASGGTGWSNPSGSGTQCTFVGGAAQIISTDATYQGIQQTILTVGKWYKVVFDVVSIATLGSGVRLRIGSGNQFTFTTTGTKTIYGIATTDGNLIFDRQGGVTDITIDNVSVKELPGNHAVAPNDLSRPVLRARYNLALQSEAITTSPWAFYNGGNGAVLSAITAPDGTTTAIGLNDTSSAGYYGVTQTVTIQTTTTYTFSTYVKQGTNTTGFSIWLIGNNSNIYFQNTISWTGGVPTASGWTATSVGNGWYRLSYTFASLTSTSVAVYFLPAPTSLTETGSTYFWGADLRTGSSAGTYQRIAAATDYATAGFLPYLAFDGTDDSFGTGSINFSATDKMSVCAGVTKLASGLGVVAELSTNASTNNGSFLVPVDYNSNDFSYYSRGTTSVPVYTSATYAAPVTAVISGISDISAPLVSIRVNGATKTSSSSSQGTGNYGNYPLFIGRRNNSTFPFNGRIYQMVVCGKTLSAAELASTEAYVATKTGVTLLVPTFDYYTTAAGDFIILDNGDNVVSDTYYV